MFTYAIIKSDICAGMINTADEIKNDDYIQVEKLDTVYYLGREYKNNSWGEKVETPAPSKSLTLEDIQESQLIIMDAMADLFVEVGGLE